MDMNEVVGFRSRVWKIEGACKSVSTLDKDIIAVVVCVCFRKKCCGGLR